MMRITVIASLLAYSLVVSQPLAYLVFLGSAQRALSPAAYIELRQRINPVMNRRVPVIYLSAVAAVVLLLVLSLRIQSWSHRITAAIALLCLVADIFFMLRENAPLNGVMDRWSTTSYPEDWERYRARWFEIFARRQVVLLIGFLSLLIAAAFLPHRV